MIKWLFYLFLALTFTLQSCDPNSEKKERDTSQQDPSNSADEKTDNPKKPEKELTKPEMVARMETSKGELLVQLYFEKTPLTVSNFVALAEGNMPNKHSEQGEPYYNGLTFHRVVPNTIVQGGCPLNTGTGNPGYRFQDEFVHSLNHNRAGMLSMANSGPNTNGSQFFFTLKPLPQLNAKHTVFGKVITGMKVLRSIEKGDEIKSIKIIRKSKEAKDFNAKNIFYQRSFETYETP